jgi:valyl-tRNA synthetase
LELALAALLRLFAPHLPFVTEEVWSWWQEGSVHLAGWPDAGALRAEAGDAVDAGDLAYTVASDVLGEIRKAKTAQQRSLRTDVERVVVSDTPERLGVLAQVADDVCEAGRVRTLDTVESDELAVEVELAESDAA